MKTLQKIGYVILLIGAIFVLWVGASFIDIASKNHPSDKHYKEYSDWNLIIIISDYMEVVK